MIHKFWRLQSQGLIEKANEFGQTISKYIDNAEIKFPDLD